MLKVGWEAIIDVRWKYFAKNGCGCRVRNKGSGREEKRREDIETQLLARLLLVMREALRW